MSTACGNQTSNTGSFLCACRMTCGRLWTAPRIDRATSISNLDCRRLDTIGEAEFTE